MTWREMPIKDEPFLTRVRSYSYCLCVSFLSTNVERRDFLAIAQLKSRYEMYLRLLMTSAYPQFSKLYNTPGQYLVF